MDLSYKGGLFIAAREAIVLVAYQDGEHMSIGLGDNDPSLKPGDEITIGEAFARFRRAIPPRVAIVAKKIAKPLQQYEFDAVFSLYYQSGTDALEDVASAINRGDRQGAALAFIKHNTNAAGLPMEGLLTRRGREVGLFLAGEYGDLRTIPFWRCNPRTTKREEYTLQPGDLPDDRR